MSILKLYSYVKINKIWHITLNFCCCIEYNNTVIQKFCKTVDFQQKKLYHYSTNRDIGNGEPYLSGKL